MIVGITARADWRGPKVLNGRTVTTGSPKEQVKGLGQLVGADLARRIRRLALQRVLLVDRHVTAPCRTPRWSRCARRRLHAGVRAACRTFSVPSTLVRTYDVGRLVRVGNGDQRGQVEDDLDAAHRAARTLSRSRDVAGHDLHVVAAAANRPASPTCPGQL